MATLLGSTISGHYYGSDNGSNILIRTINAGSGAGILLQNSAGAFKAQIYGEGSDYGFLSTAWGSWDIRKTVSGNLYLNNSTAYYLNTTGTSLLNRIVTTGRLEVTYNDDRYQMNFLRSSGTNWWVTNDSDKLGLHVNNVGDRFYFSTGGDFWSSTNGWLSTALAGKSNVGHTHDDRYYTETESDGRYQPLENQRLSTSNSPSFSSVSANDFYTTGGWFRNHTNNAGIYWQGTGWHLMPENSADFRFHSGNNSESAIRMETNGTTRGYVYANSSNEIGFLNQGRSWRLRAYSGGAVESYGDFRAPIFYDSQDTTYYLDPNSTTALRTVGSWRSDSAAWDGEFAGKIQYHSNNWYFQASSNWFFRNSGASNVVSIDSGGNISANGFVGNNSAQTRDKLRVWDGSSYTIGMKSGYDYGHLGTDEYAMSFQMNDNSGRGFWWGDDAHNDNQGAASLTTDGRMTIAKSLSVGEGEAVISPSSTPLYVKGSTSGVDVVAVDGINGRLFTVTDDLSGSLFSVNTIAGLPVIEAFADNTVTIGKYGYATTWSTTGFVTVPNSANIYRDLFINGGRSGDFGNRLIIGTNAATYTMQDGNQRPTAYLHGAYPVVTLNHTVTGNTSHGPTIQLTHDTNNKQWVIGTNGTGTRLDIGYSENTNRNPHNGIDDYNGSTFLRVDNGGNIQLGRGNGRSTWVNDTLYVGASDSGDSHMYFGEDSSGWYGLHWYWDSAFTVYLYGRNAGTDTEIMRYTTNANSYVEWRRHFHMNNYDINYLSQIHFNDDVRFYDDGNNQYLNFKWGNGGAGGIQFWDGDGSRQGYVYGSGDGSFGLLDSGGNWKVRVDASNVEMYGTQYGTDIYAYAFFDRNNVDYYLNPASYSRLWRTATHWAPSVGVGSSNWVNDFNNTPVSSMSFGGDLSAGGPQGTWWFQQNMRHSNASNYWGTQIAWGWEDNANELWQRNVTGGSWGSWVRYINTNNYAGILDARYFTETESDARYQPLENQRLSTGNNVTFNQVYTNNWFRNNASNTGLYNEATTMHLSSQSNGYWDVSSTNSESAFRFYTGGHVSAIRGYVYANSSNQVGFLNNGGSWSLRTDASRSTVLFGNLTVGQDTNASSIFMYDGDEGTREIHCNSNRVGFLNQSGSWGSWCEDDGSWRTGTSMWAPVFYDSNDSGYYLDLNSTSNLNQITGATSARWGRSGTFWTVRPNNNSGTGYWTGTNGWGTGEGTWANAWKGGFSGWDIWGSGTDHPQGGGYVHAQGIVSGVHYTNGDGSDAYGWMMVGAADAVANRYWLRGKWGTTTSGWVEMITTGNIGSQSVNYATSAGSATSSTSASYASGLSRYGIIYGDNWNTYRVNGQFIVMSAHGHSGSNRPSGAYTYGSGMSYYNSGSDHYQFYIPENSGNSNGNSQKIWYRSGWNDNWGGWRSIVDVYNSVCYIDGTVTASGDVIAYSDARVKENVHTIENALDKTLKLRGVTYNRTDVEDKSTKIGVIAQEIMEVLPEVVSEDETGMYGVSYGNLTAVLIEAIKEQQKQIEELRNELNKLKG